jgi:hypothetical protein
VWSLPLENGGLLGGLRVDGLVWQLSTNLLLMPLWHTLLLLGPLQDLRCNMARHARILWLALGELALLLILLLRVAWVGLRGWLLNRRGSSGVVVEGLGAHHGLDLLHAHDLSCRRRLLGSCGRLRGRLALGSRLLGLEAPDIGTCLELRNVLGVLVALIARPVGLGGLGDGRPLLVLLVLVLVLMMLVLVLVLLLLLLGDLLAGMEKHLLLLDGASDHGRLAGKVKMLAHRLLGGGAVAKGVVVAFVGIVVELVA